MLKLSYMKNTYQYKTITIVAGVLFALAPLAHAAVLLNSETEVKANSGAMVQTGINISASATPVKGVHGEGEIHTNVGTKALQIEDGSDIDGGERGGINGTQGTGDIKGSAHAEIHTNINTAASLENVELHFDADADINDTEESSVSDANEVHTSQDFSHFVALKAKHDANIKSVDVTDDKVEVEYKEPAKLFGFINSSVTAHATADIKGNVEVSYPWYHIFMKKQSSSAALQSKIALAIAAEQKGERSGSASTSMESQTSLALPHLFDVVARALKSASASADASVTLD